MTIDEKLTEIQALKNYVEEKLKDDGVTCYNYFKSTTGGKFKEIRTILEQQQTLSYENFEKKLHLAEIRIRKYLIEQEDPYKAQALTELASKIESVRKDYMSIYKSCVTREVEKVKVAYNENKQRISEAFLRSETNKLFQEVFSLCEKPEKIIPQDFILKYGILNKKIEDHIKILEDKITNPERNSKTERVLVDVGIFNREAIASKQQIKKENLQKLKISYDVIFENVCKQAGQQIHGSFKYKKH